MKIILTNPIGLDSIVVLRFLTASQSKSHPPHWTVKNDSNSKTGKNVLLETESERERERGRDRNN